MAETQLVYDPTAPCGIERQTLRRTLDHLTGTTVGFIDNAKPNFNHLVDDLAELLTSRYGVARVLKRGKRGPGAPAPDEIVRELAGECDVVIAGSGD